jgi:hypothetical protein
VLYLLFCIPLKRSAALRFHLLSYRSLIVVPLSDRKKWFHLNGLESILFFDNAGQNYEIEVMIPG